MKPLQPRLARDLMRQCFVREIEPKGTDEALILEKADSSRWQITFADYVAKVFSPPNQASNRHASLPMHTMGHEGNYGTPPFSHVPSLGQVCPFQLCDTSCEPY